jgi:hypothetical protein
VMRGGCETANLPDEPQHQLLRPTISKAIQGNHAGSSAVALHAL